uniref:NADH-ubiquinone oxidoreductase chain 5 n=1 Tax=Polyphaga plancyi TaxID=1804147 RepID=A0A6M9AWU9_9NEOP|nr:NADH dehydrogenase subunit 5 [Polyphaga plancyi]QKK69171.1 NADH dehydrogenase subunit 5 [Polyphaga plancyi]WGO57841.1 NADH dehydrogenase subunit 5 [Polyphaga plancyi]
MSNLSISFISFVFLFVLSIYMVMIGFYLNLINLSYFVEWELVSLNSSVIVMTFLFDYISVVFLGFVFLISSLVILYSDDYMSGDLNINRFIILVLMFVGSMMFMIISPNIISILLGWDGLGLVSYCLVIYYQNVSSYNAGMLTVLSNRIGDVALLMAIIWMMNFGSWNYIYYLNCFRDCWEMELISYLVFLAAITKSAQIPFSAWLPAAMAAPTPVSALVHSSTLVTAGVYLLIRFNPLFNDNLNMLLLFVSGLTMFMAGLGANFEYDLSKIIALSTLSQLGLMMSILSVGLAELAYFHLLTHALFKALLFMCAGMIIHMMKDCQDIRFMGGLVIQMPFTCSCFMVSNFALCGVPFLAGFYSSDLILEMVFMSYMNIFGIFLFFFSTGLTVCYTFRLFYYVMCGDFNFNSFGVLDELNLNMVVGMCGLLIMSIVGGGLLSWVLFPIPFTINLPLFMSVMALGVSVLGAWVGYLICNIDFSVIVFSISNHFFSEIMGSMWFMPFISTYGMSMISVLAGYNVLKYFDGGWSEYLGGQGIFILIVYFSKINQLLQYNNLMTFFLFFLMWLIFVVSVMIIM